LPTARITADIGGATPGSMGLATGYLRAKAFVSHRFVSFVVGEVDADTMRLLMANVRGNNERRGDFDAQIGSLNTGATRLLEIVERRGEKETREYAAQLIQYSARLMRHTISAIPDGVYEAQDALDDDGISDSPVPIVVKLTIHGQQRNGRFSRKLPAGYRCHQRGGSDNGFCGVVCVSLSREG
jgi:N-methylhydantoinase B